ncbi:hypothetical protein AGMMS49928_22310 [Spirochaetia bacterium]|nr:hypothetical protein AGMMS49928_22310 [Spirochaetia bacterium]
MIPPPTYPLSRQYIGYGVVDAAYIQVLDEPAASGLSLGHLRRGSLVKILERRISAGKAGPWVLIEGAYRGWLPEGEVQIFDNEAKAQTAAEYMTQ